MASWATKRKLLYSGTFFLIVFILLGYFSIKYFYKTPTCKDGIKNGKEQGIDCGGTCPNLCSKDSIEPIVKWSKIFNVVGEVYNLAAYIDNPNSNSSNPKVQYEFKVFDEKNVLIGSREGETFIPKNKKFVIFEPSFIIKNRKPKYVEFSFTKFSAWQKDSNNEPSISIVQQPIANEFISPKINGIVTNNSTNYIENIELVSLVMDDKENTVAVSRTFVEGLAKNSSQDFVFTWPSKFNIGTEPCLSDESDQISTSTTCAKKASSVVIIHRILK